MDTTSTLADFDEKANVSRYLGYRVLVDTIADAARRADAAMRLELALHRARTPMVTSSSARHIDTHAHSNG